MGLTSAEFYRAEAVRCRVRAEKARDSRARDQMAPCRRRLPAAGCGVGSRRGSGPIGGRDSIQTGIKLSSISSTEPSWTRRQANYSAVNQPGRIGGQPPTELSQTARVQSKFRRTTNPGCSQQVGAFDV